MDWMKMYEGAVNSEETKILYSISAPETVMYVDNEDILPETPNLLVIGSDYINAETVLMLEKNGNMITVQRGYQGVAQSWGAGTTVSRNFTEYDYRAIIRNVAALKEYIQTGVPVNLVDIDTFIHSMPIQSSEYFAKWTLYESVGGMKAPLESWGWVNATLTEVLSKFKIDLNSKTLSIFSIANYGNRIWSVHKYTEGVYILMANDKSLVLVRR